jgi:thymidine phosphorylase
MRFVDVIRSKRDGEALSRQDIEAFVAGVTGGSLPDYQVSALLMAIVLRGMTAEETAWLTDAMVA